MKPRLLFAEPEDLERLRLEADLPDGFLAVADTALEDTPLADFRELLHRSAVVALRSDLFHGSLDEPLSSEQIAKYRRNLSERVRECQSIRLVVVDAEDDKARLLGEVREFHNNFMKDPLGRTQVAVVYVVILTCPIDDELADRLNKLPNELQSPIYLMTETLEAASGNVVRAEFVWPLAVSRLLMLLAAKDAVIGPAMLAWHCLDYGLMPADDEVERLRRKFSEQILLNEPKARPAVPEPAAATEAPFFDDPAQEAMRRPSLECDQIETHPSTRNWLIDCLRATDGGGRLEKADGDSIALRQVGWETDQRRFGARLARDRMRRELILDAGNGSMESEAPIVRELRNICAEIATDFNKVAHYAQDAIQRGNAGNTSGPEQTPRIGPSSGANDHRAALVTLEEERVRNRALCIDATIAAAERDRAWDRFLGRPQRGLFALAGIVGSVAAFSYLAWILSLDHAERIACAVAIFVFAMIGAAIGVELPFRLERMALARAARMIHQSQNEARGSLRQTAEKRSLDAYRPGARNRALSGQNMALRRAAQLCRRVRFILRMAIDEATVASIRDKDQQRQYAGMDGLRNLAEEDRAEFVHGTISRLSLDNEPLHEEMQERGLFDELMRKLSAPEQESAVSKLATPVSFRGDDASPVAGLLATINQKACDWEDIWNKFCKRSSGDQAQGYWPYELLMPVATEFAIRVRAEVWRLLARQREGTLSAEDSEKIKVHAERINRHFLSGNPGDDSAPKKCVPAFASCEMKGEPVPDRIVVLYARMDDGGPEKLATAIKDAIGTDGTELVTNPHIVHFGTIFRSWRICIDQDSDRPGVWRVMHDKNQTSHKPDASPIMNRGSGDST